MKKVLVFARDLTGGGLESTLATLVPHLSSDKCDVRICCVCPKGAFQSVLSEWVVDPASTLPGRLLAALLGRAFERRRLYKVCLFALLPLTWIHLRIVLRRERPDAVMTCSAVWSGVFFLSGAPFQRSFRWMISEGSNIVAGLRAMRFYRRWPLYITVAVPFRAADGVIVPSKGCRKAFMEYFGLKRRHVRVIPNPVDLDAVSRMTSGDVQPREEVVFIGRLEAVKNLDVLVRAFALSGLASRGIRLVVYGTGSQREALEKLVSALALDGSVAFPGFVTTPYEKIRDARALVLPSRREGFGNVVLEALALGTPVVVSDCDYGPKELVLHGRCGVIVEEGCPASLAEGLVRVVTDPALTRDLTAAGLKRAKSYDVRTVSRAYEAALTRAAVLAPEKTPRALGREAPLAEAVSGGN